MIRSYIVTTTEIDDADEAARQISEQVASVKLLANTMGIITAHPEFVSSGILVEATKALTFPTVGMTSISHCAGDKAETYMMSILILTSDECGFECGLSEAIRDDGGNANEAARKCYEALRAKAAMEPEFMLIYSPYFRDAVQSDYIDGITEINANLPMFGAVANDNESPEIREGHHTFFGGEAFPDKIAMALVTGNAAPKFYVASLTEEAIIMPRVGIITAAERNRLIEINNVSAPDFFRNIGFLSADDTPDKGLLSSIFVMHSKDSGGDISRIPFSVEDGSVRCGGRFILGAPLSIAFNTKEIVLKTTKSLTDTIRANHNGGTVIFNTCIGRRFGLLGAPMAEIELIRDELNGKFNCIAVYSNGELCPITNDGGEIKNIEHNQALIACVL